MWAVGRDRLRAAREVAALAGADPSVAALEGFFSVQVALSAIDRLEVRGRDSAGLHLLVRHHGLDLDEPAIGRLIDARAADPLFGSGSVRATDRELAFVYKAAAEIGELGDNTAVLRAAIRDDALLHLALAHDDAEVMVLGHTRWASVGIISEANAHPLNHEELDGHERPYVVGALNGDVDNYADLKALEGLQVPAEITTDAKVIPALVARRMESGATVQDAFRTTVSELAGSMGIAAQTAAAPDRLLLSLRGSGQALYVGMCRGRLRGGQRALRPGGGDVHLPAHGRRDAGRSRARRRHPRPGGGARRERRGHARRHRALRVRRHAAAGARRRAAARRDHHPRHRPRRVPALPAQGDLGGAGVVPQDAARQGRRTRRSPDGDARQRDVARVAAGARCATAASAASWSSVRAPPRSPGRASPRCSPRSPTTTCAPTPWSPPSSAVSSCATTCPTRSWSRSARAAPPPTPTAPSDLARARGAAVVAIVNRRNSDLVDKSDGVLYTSDGRDVEMAVPSTKAFYAQIAAGYLLAIAIADELGAGTLPTPARCTRSSTRCGPCPTR